MEHDSDYRVFFERHVGLEGVFINMEGFGASAPGEVLYEKFGITAERAVEPARSLISRLPRRE